MVRHSHIAAQLEQAQEAASRFRWRYTFTPAIIAYVFFTINLSYRSWATDTGEHQVSSHGGDLDALHEIWWGDTAPVWCDDFETGQGSWIFATGSLDGDASNDEWTSEWSIGMPPTDGLNAPDSSPSGAAILGTNQEGDGQYRPNNMTYALSPLVTLETAHPAIVRLEAQRWLTVEHSEYDIATLETLAPDGTVTELWRNPYDIDVRDTEWQHWRTDLRKLANTNDAVHFGWTLSTDAGLEYGGWHLDDVCVVTLDDPAGHHRVQDQ